MPSAVEIANRALARISQGVPIASFEEESEPANEALAALPFARDDTLRAAAWPFATRRVTLAALDGVDATPWTYAYRVPSDCLRVLDLPVSTTTTLVPFEKAGDDGGELILTNLSPATLRYVTRVENLALWPPQAASVLAWRLAAELATTIARDAARADAMMTRFRQALSEVVAWDASEGRPPPDPEPYFIAARR